jgi:hypothetical protein
VLTTSRRRLKAPGGAAVRLAGALGVPVEQFTEWVEDPEEDEPAAPEKVRRPRKGNLP